VNKKLDMMNPADLSQGTGRESTAGILDTGQISFQVKYKISGGEAI
jgi:hypothetical protein